MQRRWFIYILIGLLFGVFDWFFLEFITRFPWQQVFGNTGIGAIIGLVVLLGLDLGIWLVPVIPIGWYEARRSRSKLKSALASLAVHR